MNPTTPRQPGDAPQHENVARDDAYASAGTASGNTYSDQYQRGGNAPDLDAAAPQLHSSDMRRMNRRAIGFLAAIVLLLLILAFLLLRTAARPSHAQKPRAQTLVVPQLPQLPQTTTPKPLAQAPAAIPAATPVQPLPVIPTQTAPTPAVTTPAGPSLVQRREMATASAPQMPEGTPAPAPAGTTQDLLSGKYGGATSAAPLTNPDTLLTQGTVIRCVLQTRIISDIPGFASCTVTGPVYSFDGKRLLLPKGSKVFGQYGAGPVGSRLAVVWNRILTPTGIDVNMSSPGVDNLGGSGLPGYLDSHWPSRISSALLISLMSDAFLYEGEKHGPNTNSIGSGGVVVQSPYQSNTAQTLQSLANQAVRQSANRPATLSINQGTVISIYVAKDVDFGGVVSRL